MHRAVISKGRLAAHGDILGDIQTRFFKEQFTMTERKSHHIRKAILKITHKLVGVILNGIRPCLIHGIPAGNIVRNLTRAERPHRHLADSHPGGRLPCSGLVQGNP